MIAAGAPAAAAGETVSDDASVHALENGEELYLVFGADLGDQTLDEYIEAHAAGEADSEVNQYQNVEQVNINQQNNATSIAIDGGEATAIQQANQYNDNEQFADAAAQNVQIQETAFEDVGTVNVVIGNGNGQQFDGWGIADKKGDKADIDADQSADTVVTQSQVVGQLNYNEQSTAFALAENGSDAIALQQSQQSNQNLQHGAANATNVYQGAGDFSDQSADATVTQEQALDQTNYNEQDSAVAIAVGDNSTATAIQLTDQTNFNDQIATADSTNILEMMTGMSVATAGIDDDGAMDEAATAMGNLADDKHHDDKHADDKKDDDKDKEHKKDDGSAQSATSEVAQAQEVEQMNVNLQSSAMALATNGSDATAVQWSHQTNVNSQVGYADALNVYAGPAYAHDSVITSDTTSVMLGGDAMDGAPGVAFDADANQTNDVEQEASAQIQQIQFVAQENINEQQAAIALADDGGSADSAQVTMQENENIQYSAVASTNVWAAV
ncbi:hypothetical protein B2G88_17085 [Natronolimnobius baerhuensis]|uniref:Uncharacterized protein n=2 Tax=Natronolimnobius baerhuensis TaxID=253108 RepID=A0A202E4X4_9EURY|nr:hypothetical protein B2G88_17085 [Natronolimnobius baerhuensis]